MQMRGAGNGRLGKSAIGWRGGRGVIGGGDMWVAVRRGELQ
jgi:hypothetical protein